MSLMATIYMNITAAELFIIIPNSCRDESYGR
jgi:hypothetical protein